MRRGWFLIVAAVLAGGCSSGRELPVHGIVTMDGTPLGGASVTFFADAKAASVGGGATTSSDGKFVVLGPKGENGLAPGTYKVTVSKMKGGPVTSEPVLEAPSEVELQRNDLPAIYSDPNRTILSYSVTGDGKPIEIKLSSKKKR